MKNLNVVICLGKETLWTLPVLIVSTTFHFFLPLCSSTTLVRRFKKLNSFLKLLFPRKQVSEMIFWNILNLILFSRVFFLHRGNMFLLLISFWKKPVSRAKNNSILKWFNIVKFCTNELSTAIPPNR